MFRFILQHRTGFLLPEDKKMKKELFIDDLLGSPFEFHGRNRKGFDCYGLVMEVEKRLGRCMIDFYAEYSEKNYKKCLNDNSLRFVNNMNLIKTKYPVLGDVILFFDSKGCAVHIGVYLKRNDFIHCDGCGVRINNLETYFRTEKEFYTWPE